MITRIPVNTPMPKLKIQAPNRECTTEIRGEKATGPTDDARLRAPALRFRTCNPVEGSNNNNSQRMGSDSSHTWLNAICGMTVLSLLSLRLRWVISLPGLLTLCPQLNPHRFQSASQPGWLSSHFSVQGDIHISEVYKLIYR